MLSKETKAVAIVSCLLRLLFSLSKIYAKFAKA